MEERICIVSLASRQQNTGQILEINSKSFKYYKYNWFVMTSLKIWVGISMQCNLSGNTFKADILVVFEWVSVSQSCQHWNTPQHKAEQCCPRATCTPFLIRTEGSEWWERGGRTARVGVCGRWLEPLSRVAVWCGAARVERELPAEAVWGAVQGWCPLARPPHASGDNWFYGVLYLLVLPFNEIYSFQLEKVW